MEYRSSSHGPPIIDDDAMIFNTAGSAHCTPPEAGERKWQYLRTTRRLMLLRRFFERRELFHFEAGVSKLTLAIDHALMNE